jgi:DNA-binding GntR family transcriptional regulator
MQDNALLSRIRSEYLEMPGMRLTLEQAQRLCGVERTLCKSALDALVESKFLSVRRDGTYARLLDGEVARRHVATADLGARRPRKVS